MQPSVAKDGVEPSRPTLPVWRAGGKFMANTFVDHDLFGKPGSPPDQFQGAFLDHAQTQKDPGICAGVFSSRQYFEISG
jgi:hypothetical protein